MRFSTKVRATIGAIFAAIGWVVGGSIGIAAMGTAIAGGWVVAIVLGGFAWFVSPAIIDKFAKRHSRKERELP